MNFSFGTSTNIENNNDNIIKLRYKLNNDVIIIIWQETSCKPKWYYDEQKLIDDTLRKAIAYYEEFKLWIDESLLKIDGAVN